MYPGARSPPQLAAVETRKMPPSQRATRSLWLYPSLLGGCFWGAEVLSHSFVGQEHCRRHAERWHVPFHYILWAHVCCPCNCFHAGFYCFGKHCCPLSAHPIPLLWLLHGEKAFNSCAEMHTSIFLSKIHGSLYGSCKALYP